MVNHNFGRARAERPLALSGRQPWWWAILHGGKRIENRRWNTTYRGPIYLHAAKGCTDDEYEGAREWMWMQFGSEFNGRIPELAEMQRGGIVGRARIVGVVPPHDAGARCHLPLGEGVTTRLATDLDYRWHMHDQFGFVLTDVEPLPFVPCKGSLGLFELPSDVVRVALGLG